MGSFSTRENILMVFIMPAAFKMGNDEKGKMLLEIAACVMLKGVKGVVWLYLVERKKKPKHSTDLLGGKVLIALEEIVTQNKAKYEYKKWTGMEFLNKYYCQWAEICTWTPACSSYVLHQIMSGWHNLSVTWVLLWNHWWKNYNVNGEA